MDTKTPENLVFNQDEIQKLNEKIYTLPSIYALGFNTYSKKEVEKKGK
ncbi:hypothetical protein [Candidatus Leptofilum sp.]